MMTRYHRQLGYVLDMGTGSSAVAWVCEHRAANAAKPVDLVKPIRSFRCFEPCFEVRPSAF